MFSFPHIFFVGAKRLWSCLSLARGEPVARTPRSVEAGFTLLELLIVVGLIAALSGLLLGGGRYAFENGRVARARAELSAWSVALEGYRTTHGDYPRSLGELGREPAALLDPWGNPYRFAYKSQVPWTNPGYVLGSAGPDGVASNALRAGGFADTAGAANADNLWANPP